MKIDQTRGLTPLNPYKKQIGQTKDVSAAEQGKKRDVVNISQEALKLQGDNRIVKERSERVDSLKKQIEAGQYQVDHKAVAEKMVAYFKQIGGIDQP